MRTLRGHRRGLLARAVAVAGLVAVVLVAAALPAWATPGYIITVAGTPGGAYNGDNQPAVNAKLNDPLGVAANSSGGFYIADSANNRVREVNSSGTITTVAGTGVAGFGGDGGPAIDAELNDPDGVAVDSAGDLFIADSNNNRIREVTPAGMIFTVAGNGVSGGGGDGGLAVNAELHAPAGLTINSSGDLYVADVLNNRVRRIDASGTITTVAGTGVAGYNGDDQPAVEAELNQPFGVTLDQDGDLYIADSLNNRVREVDASGTITTVAGDGVAGYNGVDNPYNDEYPLAINSELNDPDGVAFDSYGNLYIADANNERVRVVNNSGQMINVAGDGIAGDADYGDSAIGDELWQPAGLAVSPSDVLYIADALANGVNSYQIGDAGIMDQAVGGVGYGGFNGDNQPAVEAELHDPQGIAVDSSGDVYIVDQANNRVRKVDPSGTITTVAGTGVAGYSGDGGPAIDAELNVPTQIAVDSAGNLYISDFGNYRIRKVSPSGIITTIAGDGGYGDSGDGGPAIDAEMEGPEGLAVDASGDVYFADLGTNQVREVTAAGTIVRIAGVPGQRGLSGDNPQPAVDAWLNGPYGIALDSSGNLYIADASNSRIREVNPSGIMTTFAILDTFVNGEVRGVGPEGVTVDSAGNLYVAEMNANRVVEIDPTGAITGIAGTGIPGYNGDNQLATNAQLVDPVAVALDNSGDIYISDNGNQAIREVTETQGPELPEAPFAVLLPLAGLALLGSAWWLKGRRRRLRTT